MGISYFKFWQYDPGLPGWRDRGNGEITGDVGNWVLAWPNFTIFANYPVRYYLQQTGGDPINGDISIAWTGPTVNVSWTGLSSQIVGSSAPTLDTDGVLEQAHYGNTDKQVYLRSQILDCPNFASDFKVVMSGPDGFTDVVSGTGLPTGMDPASGVLSAGVLVPQVVGGSITAIALRAGGGLLRQGTYRVLATIGGVVTPIGQAVVAASVAYTAFEIASYIGRSLISGPTAAPIQIEYTLPTAPSCPTDYIPAQPLPQELAPSPPTGLEPAPITPPDTPDPGPTPKPVGLDICCSYLGDCLDGIKSALYAQNSHLDYLGECIDVRGAEIQKTLSQILGVLVEFQKNGVKLDEELKQVLQDIAKSLVVGYDDPGGIKERIADICATFLNLIDSRRG